jgi:hypothetical protein
MTNKDAMTLSSRRRHTRTFPVRQLAVVIDRALIGIVDRPGRPRGGRRAPRFDDRHFFRQVDAPQLLRERLAQRGRLAALAQKHVRHLLAPRDVELVGGDAGVLRPTHLAFEGAAVPADKLEDRRRGGRDAAVLLVGEDVGVAARIEPGAVRDQSDRLNALQETSCVPARDGLPARRRPRSAPAR